MVSLRIIIALFILISTIVMVIKLISHEITYIFVNNLL